MKKRYLIIVLFLVVFGLNFLSQAKTENNGFEYRLYNPDDVSGITQRVLKTNKDTQIIFIVDFSNSMNEYIGSKTKVEMAREVLAEILPKISPDVKVGLRVYGHRAGFTYLDGCQASKLTVAPNYNNSNNIIKSLYSTNAIGWTPITYSLKQTVNNDFAYATGRKHVILLTDGGENCDESPCTYAINLMKQRSDITIDVIAFDISDVEANNQLRCTALMTSGRFLSAQSEDDLTKSLFETVGVSKNVRGDIKIME